VTHLHFWLGCTQIFTSSRVYPDCDAMFGPLYCVGATRHGSFEILVQRGQELRRYWFLSTFPQVSL